MECDCVAHFGLAEGQGTCELFREVIFIFYEGLCFRYVGIILCPMVVMVGHVLVSQNRAVRCSVLQLQR
jgi:hypothetical protein